MEFDKTEKKLLLELICNEQIHMIIKDHTKYDSDKYMMLETLKTKINEMWGGFMIGTLIGVAIVAFCLGTAFGVVIQGLCSANKRNDD